MYKAKGMTHSLKPSYAPGLKITMQVLVADSDVLLLTLMGSILKSFGIENIHYANTGKECMDILNRKEIDLVISEWPMPVTNNSGNVVTQIRHSEGSKFQKIPAIVLTGNDNLKAVVSARDAGANEFLLKPFKVSNLCKRLKSLIEQPREFVICKNYVGPNRRRKQPIPNIKDRRMPEEEVKKRTKREQKRTVIQLDDQQIIIEDPDHNLRRKIGEAIDVTDIFSQDAIESAEEIITEAGKEFCDGAAEDLRWLRNGINRLAHDMNNVGILPPMRRRVTSLKSKASIFGFLMATNTSHSLEEYLNKMVEPNDDRLMVLREHLDILNVVFTQKIQGTGGEQGHKLINYVQKLKERYPPH